MTPEQWAERMRRNGMSEKAIAKDLRCRTCEHDYGDTYVWTFLGCTQTCKKCGQMVCIPNHCG